MDFEKPPHLTEYSSIHKLATQSIDWVNRNLELFCPIREKQIDFYGIKAFMELALVYSYLHQSEHLQLNKHLPTWYKFIIEQCEDPSYAQMARKHPDNSFAYLLPYLLLRTTGIHSEYYEETLEILSRWGYPQITETIPYRNLEKEFIFWKSGYSAQEPDWFSLYQATILGKHPLPIYLNDGDAYSITHTLFYVTDFGNQSPPTSLVDKEKVSSIVECLMLHYLRVKNWDLLGELLINLNGLGRQNSLIYTESAKAFHSAWRNDGSVPTRQDLTKQLEALQEKNNTKEVFGNCYHTTLVGILYCISSMNRIIKERSGIPC